MPKKFVGENSKAVAARARKNAAKEAEVSKKQKQIEDAYWEDNDKNIKKRQQKKDELEKKKQQALDKKAEMKAILEKEMESIAKVTKSAPAPKITRAQIVTEKQKKEQQIVPKAVEQKMHDEKPLEENINRLEQVEVASTIDEAIEILNTTSISAVDKHPEKRMKAAFTAFEEKNLPRLKEENPTLRLSQLKQLLHKEWLKSSENPMCRND